jgi:hypothetical protein
VGAATQADEDQTGSHKYPAYLSAVSALAGPAIAGVTFIATAWLTTTSQVQTVLKLIV